MFSITTRTTGKGQRFFPVFSGVVLPLEFESKAELETIVQTMMKEHLPTLLTLVEEAIEALDSQTIGAVVGNLDERLHKARQLAMYLSDRIRFAA